MGFLVSPDWWLQLGVGAAILTAVARFRRWLCSTVWRKLRNVPLMPVLAVAMVMTILRANAPDAGWRLRASTFAVWGILFVVLFARTRSLPG